jgi:AFG3 family protein
LVGIQFQIRKGISQLKKSNVDLEDLVRRFCQKPPKGFEKFFRPAGSKPPPTTEEKSGEAKDGTKKEAPPPPSKGASPPLSKPPPGPGRPFDQWSFGSFGGGSGGAGSNKERDQWFMLAVFVTMAAIGAIALFEMGYKEITWKEFVNKYAVIPLI